MRRNREKELYFSTFEGPQKAWHMPRLVSLSVLGVNVCHIFASQRNQINHDNERDN